MRIGSRMSPNQIKLALNQRIGQKLCGRISKGQLNNLNQEFRDYQLSQRETMRYATFLSTFAVFGMLLVGCNSKEQVKQIEYAQRVIYEVSNMRELL